MGFARMGVTGVRRPGVWCGRIDLDHLIAWPAGATSQENLHTKCRIDHRLKHEGRWHHQLSTDPEHPPGTVILTSPTGHLFISKSSNYNGPWPDQPHPRRGRNIIN